MEGITRAIDLYFGMCTSVKKKFLLVSYRRQIIFLSSLEIISHRESLVYKYAITFNRADFVLLTVYLYAMDECHADFYCV